VRHLAAARHVDLASVSGTGVGGRITHQDIDRAAVAAAGEPAAAGAPPPGAETPARRVSPYARRLAAQLGVPVADLVGTGPGGAIGAKDVRRANAAAGRHPTATPAGPALAAAPPARPAAAAIRLDGSASGDRTASMRATIAALMARSKREIPHYYLAESIDLGAALTWLRERNRLLPVPERIVPAALLLKAAALAAARVPELNGFWIDGGFVPGPAVHLGVAVSLRGGGLVAPAIHNASDLDLTALMARMRDLVARTRAGRLRGSEMSDPTITVSNLGEQGAESILGVIYPPQVGLVGFGRIVERPWAVDGLLGVRPVVTASLAADHRASDGATGARYLQAVSRLLQRPEEL
jgi:pyruvate dehydrogenase E2 component (dihydrolipoamide acetyltransferase)